MTKGLSSSKVWSPCIQPIFLIPVCVEGKGQVHDDIQGARTIILWGFILIASPTLVSKPVTSQLRQSWQSQSMAAKAEAAASQDLGLEGSYLQRDAVCGQGRVGNGVLSFLCVHFCKLECHPKIKCGKRSLHT